MKKEYRDISVATLLLIAYAVFVFIDVVFLDRLCAHFILDILDEIGRMM